MQCIHDRCQQKLKSVFVLSQSTSNSFEETNIKKCKTQLHVTGSDTVQFQISKTF